MKKIGQLLIMSLMFLLLTSYAASMQHVKQGQAVKGRHAKLHKKQVKRDELSVVDINHANKTALVSLKGVGPKKADAIIAYRDKNGSFKSVEDLSAVKGISKKSLARLVKLNSSRIAVHNN